MAIFNDYFFNGNILLNMSTIFYCALGQTHLSVRFFPNSLFAPITLFNFKNDIQLCYYSFQMEKSKDINQEITTKLECPPDFFERLWSAYSSVDEQRRHTFYLLYLVMIVYSILWITKGEEFVLPLIETKVDPNIAFLVFPAFIIILIAKYLYLCAHSLISYFYYIGQYYKTYNRELIGLDYSILDLYRRFRLKDMTEKFNVFKFPQKVIEGTDKQFPFLLRKLSNIFVNISIILSLIIPFSAYVFVLFWLKANRNILMPGLVGLILLIFYTILGTGTLFLPINFYFQVKSSKKEFMEKFNQLL